MAKEKKLSKHDQELVKMGFTIGKPSPKIGTKAYQAKAQAEYHEKYMKKHR